MSQTISFRNHHLAIFRHLCVKGTILSVLQALFSICHSCLPLPFISDCCCSAPRCNDTGTCSAVLLSRGLSSGCSDAPIPSLGAPGCFSHVMVMLPRCWVFALFLGVPKPESPASLTHTHQGSHFTTLDTGTSCLDPP